MMKNKDYHLKISDGNLDLLKQIAVKDNIRLSQVFDRAIELFLKLKRITPWDSIPKKKQEALKNKAKSLVK